MNIGTKEKGSKQDLTTPRNLALKLPVMHSFLNRDLNLNNGHNTTYGLYRRNLIHFSYSKI